MKINGIECTFNGGSWDVPGNTNLGKYFLDNAHKSSGQKTQEKTKMVDAPKAGGPKFQKQMGQFKMAAWENDRLINGQNVKVINLTLSRSYKNKEDKWIDEKIYCRANDLPKIASVCMKAFDALYEKGGESGAV